MLGTLWGRWPRLSVRTAYAHSYYQGVGFPITGECLTR